MRAIFQSSWGQNTMCTCCCPGECTGIEGPSTTVSVQMLWSSCWQPTSHFRFIIMWANKWETSCMHATEGKGTPTSSREDGRCSSQHGRHEPIWNCDTIVRCIKAHLLLTRRILTLVMGVHYLTFVQGASLNACISVAVPIVEMKWPWARSKISREKKKEKKRFSGGPFWWQYLMHHSFTLQGQPISHYGIWIKQFVWNFIQNRRPHCVKSMYIFDRIGGVKLSKLMGPELTTL